jgi:oxygen-independent coproporphyrinogen-3 oxidase
LYRQKNTVGNLENVGYAKAGHDGMYNIFMMEELHSIFAVGAGAVTKLVVKQSGENGHNAIVRIFTPKYPYEYLRDADLIRLGDAEAGKESIEERIVSFYKEHGLFNE